MSVAGTLYTDGGARGNPGPAGVGYILSRPGQAAISEAAYIGKATNNEAEYTALVRGLARARTEGITHLTCYLDSELLVAQLNGDYRVKEPRLKPLHAEVNRLARAFAAVGFHHIPRQKNRAADKLVNQAIDQALH